MIIPGLIISTVTFPGVMVHEFSHLLMCRLTNTKVHKVCYFRFGNPSGYVIHESPASAWRHLLIGIGPLIINTGIGVLLGMLIIQNVFNADGLFIFFWIFLLWMAISIAMHSFPSTGDAKAIFRTIWSRKASLLSRLIGTPLVFLIYLGAIGSFFWLDLVYGILVVVGIPYML